MNEKTVSNGWLAQVRKGGITMAEIFIKAEEKKEAEEVLELIKVLNEEERRNFIAFVRAAKLLKKPEGTKSA